MQVTYNGGRARRRAARTSPTASPTSRSPTSPTRASTSTGNADTSNGRPTPTCRSWPAARRSPTTSRWAASWSRNLRLSGETLAKIFTNKITNWNDPAITKDNNGRAFPVADDHAGRPLRRLRHDRAVHDLDGQAVPVDLAAVLRQGRADVVLPAPGPRDRPGRLGPGDEHDHGLRAATATIGYVEYSYPLNKRLPGRQGPNKAGYFVEPTQYNVAVALTKAQINQDTSSSRTAT